MKHGIGLCRVRAGQEYTFPRLVQRLQGEKSLYLHRRLQALVLTRARVLVRWSVGTLLDGNAHRSANAYAVVQCGRASCVVRGRAAVGRHDNKYCADGTTARLRDHISISACSRTGNLFIKRHQNAGPTKKRGGYIRLDDSLEMFLLKVRKRKCLD
jgi:hypothetical protein